MQQRKTTLTFYNDGVVFLVDVVSDDGSDESPCKKFQTAIEMRLMGEEANMTALYTTIPLAETSTISSN